MIKAGERTECFMLPFIKIYNRPLKSKKKFYKVERSLITIVGMGQKIGLSIAKRFG